MPPDDYRTRDAVTDCDKPECLICHDPDDHEEDFTNYVDDERPPTNHPLEPRE